MKYDILKKVVTGKQKGSFSSMVWERQLPVKKAYSGHIITKRSNGVVRFGVEYDNMKSVQQKRADGILPSENAGLTWGEWSMYPYFIKHKGNTYLRCTESPNNKVQTEYFLDGRKVFKEEISSMCLKSAFNNHGEMDCFTVNIDNIISVR